MALFTVNITELCSTSCEQVAIFRGRVCSRCGLNSRQTLPLQLHTKTVTHFIWWSWCTSTACDHATFEMPHTTDIGRPNHIQQHTDGYVRWHQVTQLVNWDESWDTHWRKLIVCLQPWFSTVSPKQFHNGFSSKLMQTAQFSTMYYYSINWRTSNCYWFPLLQRCIPRD